MDSDSFNLIALNLVIGLTRGNRWLSPLSTDLSVLGYEVFEIEPGVVTNGGLRTPDVLLASKVTSHSVLGEWTAAQLDERKRGQLIAFSSVTDHELVTQLGVPQVCVGAVGTWVIVPPTVAEPYEELVRDGHARALLSTLSSPDSGGYVLEGVAGTTASAELDGLLSRRTHLRRIPQGYCRLYLSNLSWENLAEHVVHALVRLAYGGELEFGIEALCRNMVRVWDDLSTTIQKPIGANVRKAVNQMTRQQYVGRWLKRTQENPPQYEIDERLQSDPVPMLEAFQRALDRFLAELADEPIQLPLPAFDPAKPTGSAGF